MIRLLIVDDEVMFRKGLLTCVHWLENGIYVVGEAGNGRDAIQLIRILHPNVVLLDIKMPVIDGVEVVKTVIPEFPDMKIIMLSCLNEFEYVRDSMKAGAKDYLFKPIASAQDILEAVLSQFSELPKTECSEPDISNSSIIPNVIRFIEQNYRSEITLDDLAKVACLSKNYFCKAFGKATSKTPMEYLMEYRIQVAV